MSQLLEEICIFKQSSSSVLVHLLLIVSQLTNQLLWFFLTKKTFCGHFRKNVNLILLKNSCKNDSHPLCHNNI